MDLLPSEEHEEIAATAASFLSAEFPIADLRTRRYEPAALDPAVWPRCAELGWFGLGLAEEHGGVGYGLAEEVLLFRELGRHLAPGPFVATTLAARTAVGAGRADLAAAILAGEAMVGLAQPRSADASIGGRVGGVFDLFDAVGADYVLALDDTGAALVAVADLGPVTSRACIDPGVRLGRAEPVAAPAAAYVPAGTEALFGRGSVLAAAVLVGIAEATRDMSAAYAKDRVQFGRPIGVHQAIKHRCADMAVRAEAAKSQLLFAALSVESGRPDAPFQAAAAKVVAAGAGISNAAETIQLHGGIGYSFAHDAHLFLKRAHVVAEWMGAPRWQMGRLLDLPAAQ